MKWCEKSDFPILRLRFSTTELRETSKVIMLKSIFPNFSKKVKFGKEMIINDIEISVVCRFLAFMHAANVLYKVAQLVG